MTTLEAFSELVEGGGNAFAVAACALPGAVGHSGVIVCNRAPLFGPMDKTVALNLVTWLCVVANIESEEVTKAIDKAQRGG